MLIGADYRLYSVGGKPVFAAPARLRRAALQRYQPSTPRRAAYRWLLGLSMLVDADRLLSRSIERPLEAGAALDLEACLTALRRELGLADLQAAVFWPPEAARGRVYVHLFECQTPVAFVKISVGPRADAALQREARTLHALRAQGLRRCRVPRVLAEGPAFLALEALPALARPLAWDLASYPRHSVEEFSGPCLRLAADQVQGLSWWPRYREKVDGRTAVFHGELASLLALGVDVRRAHGDLSLHNVVQDGPELWIFDWEESCPDAPARTDELGFAMALDYGRVLANPDLAITALKKRLARADARGRLETMMVLAFRHASNLRDATLLIHHWSEFQ